MSDDARVTTDDGVTHAVETFEDRTVSSDAARCGRLWTCSASVRIDEAAVDCLMCLAAQEATT